MIAEITDYISLEKHLKNSKLRYRDAVLDYYKQLGNRLNYTVRENPSIIKNAVNYGKIDLIWLEPNITFTAEFGNLEEIYKHLWKIMEYSPNMAVLLLSSKAACRADEVAKIVDGSQVLENKRNIFLIMDLSERKTLRTPGPPQPLHDL